jgi:hypothetical protein
MDSVLKSFNKYPELIDITSGLFDKKVNYGIHNLDFIMNLVNVYQNYFKYKIVVFLPILKPEYDTDIFKIATLELIESLVVTRDTIIVFGYFEMILKSFGNTSRLLTQLKNLKCKIHIISFSLVKLPVNFTKVGLINQFSLNDISLIDFLDPDPETFDENMESFIEFVNDLVFQNKRIYMSLNLSSNKLLLLENKIKSNGISISRRDNPSSQIVINSSLTTERSILENTYSVYIMILPEINSQLDLLIMFKDIPEGSEIYTDSSQTINYNSGETVPEQIFKDSNEYPTYLECIRNLTDPVLAMDNYYTFESPEYIQKLNLSNLTKKEYDLIRNFVKSRLSNKFGIDTKTCQLGTPCSPKNRSRNLNSLSNKISSFNYRCDVTCEIFKNYSIGVIVWNELFSSRKLNTSDLKNQVYIYQTTLGTWKYSC